MNREINPSKKRGCGSLGKTPRNGLLLSLTLVLYPVGRFLDMILGDLILILISPLVGLLDEPPNADEFQRDLVADPRQRPLM